MRIVRPYLFLLVFATILSSCQKQVDNIDEPGEHHGTSGTYQPVTANSYWIYRDSATGTTTTTTMTSETKNINGVPYVMISSITDTETDTGYFGRVGADYYTYQVVLGGTTSGTFLLHYLNDTAAVGSSWEYAAGQANGLDAYVKTTVLGRKLSVTVNGKTFNNVIHTQLELSYDVLGGLTHAGTFDYFIAKDIGIVRIQAVVNFLGISYDSISDCIEYQIK
jgi:hypothetical protein